MDEMKLELKPLEQQVTELRSQVATLEMRVKKLERFAPREMDQPDDGDPPQEGMYRGTSVAADPSYYNRVYAPEAEK